MENINSISQRNVKTFNVNNLNTNNVKRLTLDIEKEAKQIALSLDDVDSLRLYCKSINLFGLKETRAMAALAKDKGRVPKLYFSGIYKNKGVAQ